MDEEEPPDPDLDPDVAMGWIIFALMLLYFLIVVITRSCALATGLTHSF